MAKQVKLASQVELTVLTREDEVTAAHIAVRYPQCQEPATVYLSATEMDALVASWQRERRKVILNAEERRPVTLTDLLRWQCDREEESENGENDDTTNDEGAAS